VFEWRFGEILRARNDVWRYGTLRPVDRRGFVAKGMRRGGRGHEGEGVTYPT
jgi:hypothetical protein